MDVNASHSTATRMYVKSFYSLTTKEPKKLCIPRNLGLHRWIPRAKCLCHDECTFVARNYFLNDFRARLWSDGKLFFVPYQQIATKLTKFDSDWKSLI